MGSVKDLEILKEPGETYMGEGVFIFSDRYSVFDWGEMPDLIPKKGEAIAILGAYFFEKLETQGFKTHYIGILDGKDIKRLEDLDHPSNKMVVNLVREIRPRLKNDGSYDYSIFKTLKSTFLIPLEVIYRNYLPPGSSVFKRLKEGSITFKDLGLEKYPEPGEKLNSPLIDFSTKLEITDRYLSLSEAQEISGLSDEEMKELVDMVFKVNEIISKEFEKIGLVNQDGKFEFGFDPDRKLMFVDVLGTLDECRFVWNDIPVSKEIARMYYRKTKWYEDVEEAKKINRQKWKEICKSKPDPLPKRLKELISKIYQACTNEITEREWFKGTGSLKSLLEEVKEFI